MWGNKNPEPKNNAPAKAPEPVAVVPAKPPVAAAPIPTPSPVAATPAPVAAAPVFSSPAPSAAPQMSATASRIGPGLKIHGVISGESDLIVEGETNGKIYLAGARVTVAKSGKVQADIEGLEINIEGSVQGNLKASDRIRLGAASNVQGSLQTPRIAIEDGARLRGKVEMTRAGEPVKVNDSKPTAASAPVKVEAKPENKIEQKLEQKIEPKVAETKPVADTKPGAVISSAKPAGSEATLRAAAANTQGD
jgi:cytoskeletal protein CcmA (bactofilin family)